MNNPGWTVDMDVCQRRKTGEDACGDAFASRRLEGEGRLVAVLSDGLGSGVKANILATMTAAMALKFAAGDMDFTLSAEVMMDALPVCAVRRISYATFTIVDARARGSARVIEMGNPPFLLVRGGAAEPVPFVESASPKWENRAMRIYDFETRPDDRIVFFSDGVTQAGMGSLRHPLGWRDAGCAAFVLGAIAERPDISARELSERVVAEATRKEPGYRPMDDMTCAVAHFRQPRRLLVFTGPPFHRERDAECARMVASFPGRKAVCGGTTAEILARELGREVVVELGSRSEDVPPLARMDGVDLVTEGIFTLTKAARLLESGDSPARRDAASALVDLFRGSDIIEFIVGTKVNEAHQSPDLPLDLELRRSIVRRLAAALSERHLKSVSIKYV